MLKAFFEILNRRKPAWCFIVFGNDAAADLVAGVSGRLCGEVVGCAVDDQSSADDLRQFKSVGIKGAVSVAPVTEKRGQVAGMLRMRQSAGVVVRTGLIKGKRAVACFVNVHGVELTVGRSVLIRQVEDLRFDQDTA